jgi:hypothetical protein
MSDNIRKLPSGVTRVVETPLIRDASVSLARTSELTGLSEVDVVNVAIQIYGLLAERVLDGDEIILRHSDRSTSKLDFDVNRNAT